MYRKTLVSLFAVALSVAPAFAQTTVLLNDDFDAETPGLGVTGGLANWNVAGNSVDVVADNSYGIRCFGNAGSCIDLDGSPGPGGIESHIMYSFAAGDVARLEFAVSGSQRSLFSSFDDFTAAFSFSGDANIANAFIEYVDFGFTDPIPGGSVGVNDPYSVTLDQIDWDTPWVTLAIGFTVLDPVNIGFSFSTSSADKVGPLLDNVKFTRSVTAVPEPGALLLLASGLFAVLALGVSRSRSAHGRSQGVIA